MTDVYSPVVCSLVCVGGGDWRGVVLRCCRVQMLARSAAGVWQPAAASSQGRLAVQSPQLTWSRLGSRTWWEDSQLSTEQRKDREAVITVLSPRAAPCSPPSCPCPAQSHPAPLGRPQIWAWPGLAWPPVLTSAGRAQCRSAPVIAPAGRNVEI